MLYLVGEFLHSPLIFADSFNSISAASLLSFNLNLQLTHLEHNDFCVKFVLSTKKAL